MFASQEPPLPPGEGQGVRGCLGSHEEFWPGTESIIALVQAA